MVLAKNYALWTDAPESATRDHVTAAWNVGMGVRRWGDIEELGNGLRCEIMGNVVDFVFTEDAEAGGTVVTSDIQRTMVSQDKLLLVIPFGRKQVKGSDIAKSVLKRTARALTTSGYQAQWYEGEPQEF